MSNKALVPFEATHPGELIKDELKERGLTQKRLYCFGKGIGYSGRYVDESSDTIQSGYSQYC